MVEFLCDMDCTDNVFIIAQDMDPHVLKIKTLTLSCKELLFAPQGTVILASGIFFANRLAVVVIA